MDTTGNVARMIEMLQRGRPGAAARDRGYSAPNFRALGARHGSFERGGARNRDRSRDHPIQPGPLQPPLGPQNTADLEKRFEDVNDRLDTVERYLRLHAQTIAITDEVVSDGRQKLKLVTEDIDAYKNYMQTTLGSVETFVTDKMSSTQMATTTLASNIELLGINWLRLSRS